MLRKFAFSTCIGVVIALYTTFVLQHLWNWFVVSAFHTFEISFWTMYGITLVVGLLIQWEDTTTFHQLKGLTMMVEALEVCMPVDKREQLDEKFTEEMTGFGIWKEIGLRSLSKIARNTFVLVMGWAVHVFLV
jgi:hypothetical protein